MKRLPSSPSCSRYRRPSISAKPETTLSCDLVTETSQVEEHEHHQPEHRRCEQPRADLVAEQAGLDGSEAQDCQSEAPEDRESEQPAGRPATALRTGRRRLTAAVRLC